MIAVAISNLNGAETEIIAYSCVFIEFSPIFSDYHIGQTPSVIPQDGEGERSMPDLRPLIQP